MQLLWVRVFLFPVSFVQILSVRPAPRLQEILRCSSELVCPASREDGTTQEFQVQVDHNPFYFVFSVGGWREFVHILNSSADGMINLETPADGAGDPPGSRSGCSSPKGQVLFDRFTSRL